MVNVTIKCGQPDRHQLLRKFKFQFFDLVDLFIESIDGLIDAVAYGSALVNKDVVNGLLFFHGVFL
jgi:hypothetical protein